MLERMVGMNVLTRHDVDYNLDKIFFYYDERGGGTERRKSKVIGTKNQAGRHHRSTIITTGDAKDTFHTTTGVIVYDHMLVEPFIIQSACSVTKDNSEHIPENWGVAANKSGSMTLDLFMSFCVHFVVNVMKPRGFGPKLKACIIEFDGHASRWSYAGIMYLISNNCWPFCIAAHTSAWSQVGDNAANAKILASLSYFYSIWKSKFGTLVAFKRSDYNWCYVRAHYRVNEQLKTELLTHPLPQRPSPPLVQNCGK